MGCKWLVAVKVETRSIVASALLVGLYMTSHARAVVLAPGDAGVPMGSLNRPPDGVVGLWDTDGSAGAIYSPNASAVAIDPNWAITVRHSNGGGPAPTATIRFNGTEYKVAEEFTPTTGNVDLRLVRLTKMDGVTPANLGQYTRIFTGDDKNLNQDFVVGGFGRGRDANLTTTNGTYGYTWDSDQSLKWGANTIAFEDEPTVVAGETFKSKTLGAYFDGPTSSSHIAHEAAIAEWDSGSGWFVKDSDNNWQVRAMGAYTDHDLANVNEPANESLFASHDDALTAAPDPFQGIRIAAYADFINSHLPEPASASMIGLSGAIALLRRYRR